MNYKDTIKKVLLIVLGIVVLAFVLAWFLNKRQASDQREQVLIDLGTSIEKTEVAAGQIPEKFPTNVPIESGAKIVQNYNASVGDGRFQATRVFETKKTLAENFQIYQNFLQTNGWDVRSTVNQTNYKMLFAVKGNAHLQIAMDDNTSTKVKTVDISYTEVTTSSK